MTTAKVPTLAVVPAAKGEGAEVLQPSGWPLLKSAGQIEATAVVPR